MGRAPGRARSLTWALDSSRDHVAQPTDLELAHKHSIRHRAEILNSTVCGCFYCGATYSPGEITDWTDWPDGTPEGFEAEYGETALCPRCGIDSVIGSASGFPISEDFLASMRVRWFETFVEVEDLNDGGAAEDGPAV